MLQNPRFVERCESEELGGVSGIAVSAGTPTQRGPGWGCRNRESPPGSVHDGDLLKAEEMMGKSVR